MPLPKGKTNNPNGRPKGVRNKRTKNLLEKLDEIDAYLESKGKGLRDCAAEDPAWYHENFTKPRIPKNIELTGAGGGPVQTLVEVRFATGPQNNG